ncbi:MAG: RNA methyltransferase [Chitinophagales bacterium]|nr:RNA methyltransferase [Chitinophagales bacterium]MCZ2392885.1 RNA methyltransferase [Chitinophagales bacterium]
MSFAISSLQNKRLKDLRLIMEKSKERRETGLFVIDGWKEILMAKDAGYYIQSLFVRDGSTYKKEIDELWPENRPESVLVFRDIFDKLSYRGVTSGAIAIAEAKQHSLNQIQLSANPTILVLDAIEKPGNLGAMIRTADATAIDAIICCDTATDIYNPNVIRSSVGCVFSVPTAMASRDKTIEWLKENHIQILTTSLKSSITYTQMNLKLPTAFVLGTEATGVHPIWEDCSNQNIILPMLGKNDSLNVSNTAAVLLYEALRQRNK